MPTGANTPHTEPTNSNSIFSQPIGLLPPSLPSPVSSVVTTLLNLRKLPPFSSSSLNSHSSHILVHLFVLFICHLSSFFSLFLQLYITCFTSLLLSPTCNYLTFDHLHLCGHKAPSFSFFNLII